MLRNWYQQTNESEIWEKLRLVIAYATDDYGRLDLRQSPFNVGVPIKLEEFNIEQVKNLASRHGLSRDSVADLMNLVGGHPYLVRLAFYHLYYEEIILPQLLIQATTDSGIYKNYLLYLLETLENQPDLKTAFKLIMSNPNGANPSLKTHQMYQLEGMGLIKFEHNYVKVRCKLYRQYFDDRL